MDYVQYAQYNYMDYVQYAQYYYLDYVHVHTHCIHVLLSVMSSIYIFILF